MSDTYNLSDTYHFPDAYHLKNTGYLPAIRLLQDICQLPVTFHALNAKCQLLPVMATY